MLRGLLDMHHRSQRSLTPGTCQPGHSVATAQLCSPLSPSSSYSHFCLLPASIRLHCKPWFAQPGLTAQPGHYRAGVKRTTAPRCRLLATPSLFGTEQPGSTNPPPPQPPQPSSLINPQQPPHLTPILNVSHPEDATAGAPPGQSRLESNLHDSPLSYFHLMVRTGEARWWNSLSATARVALFTGGYITVAGLAALLFPLQLLALLFPASVLGPGWVRVGATLAVLFGAYYLGAALDDLEGRKPVRMYQATVLGRVFLALVFTWLVASRQGGAGLLLLGAANAAGAWRMTAALTEDGARWQWGMRTSS